MTLPGFGAEATLQRPSGPYAAGAVGGRAGPVVAPQGIMDWVKCGVAAVGGAAACAGSAGLGCWAGAGAASIACGDAIDKAIKQK